MGSVRVSVCPQPGGACAVCACREAGQALQGASDGAGGGSVAPWLPLHPPAACGASTLRRVRGASGVGVARQGDGGRVTGPQGGGCCRAAGVRCTVMGARCTAAGACACTPCGSGCRTAAELSVHPSVRPRSEPCTPRCPPAARRSGGAINISGGAGGDLERQRPPRPPAAARPCSPKIRPFLINNFPPFGSCRGFFPLRMGETPLYPAAPPGRPPQF